jgi:hypothetical protein
MSLRGFVCNLKLVTCEVHANEHFVAANGVHVDSAAISQHAANVLKVTVLQMAIV